MDREKIRASDSAKEVTYHRQKRRTRAAPSQEPSRKKPTVPSPFSKFESDLLVAASFFLLKKKQRKVYPGVYQVYFLKLKKKTSLPRGVPAVVLLKVLKF